MELSETNLRYLLAIQEEAQNTMDVSSLQVARRLGVTKPTLVRVAGALMERGLIVKERYGKIYLTDRGVFTAQYYRRLTERILKNFPLELPGLCAEERTRAALALAAALPTRYFDAAWQKLYGAPEENA